MFLLHGLGRTPLSMALLARRLRKLGYRTSLFGYSVTFERFERIVDRFVDHVGRKLAADRARGVEPGYAVVGHSLGNVITRAASPRLPPGLRRFVMLAPPCRPPAVVTALAGNPLFRAYTRDTGHRLGREEFFAELPPPPVPTLVVAGTRGPSLRWLPFAGEANDGILRLEETELDGCERLVVHAAHTFVMNRRDVFRAVAAFLGPDLPAPQRR